jgi:hypothetical protein
MAFAALDAATPAAAQSVLQPRSPGISMGRFVLYPSLTLEYTDDRNVFYRSEDLPENLRISSGVLVARPRLMLDMPIRDGRLRWAYAAQYRDYTTSAFDQEERLSHFFDLEGSFRLGSRVGLALRDHFVRATIELQEIDQGGELTFGLTPFETHSPEMELTVDLGARNGFSLIPRYSSVSFDEDDEASFFNYRRRELEFRYNYRLDPSSQVYAYYSFEDTDQNREQLLYGDVAVTSRSAGVGWARALHPALVGRLAAGYRSMEFEGGGEQNFSGAMVRGGVSWRLSEATALDLTVGRLPYQSFFVNSNFYVNTQARLVLRQQLGQRTFWQIGVGAQRNAYPEAVDIAVTPTTDPALDADMDGLVDAFESLEMSQGVKRRDRVLSVEAGAGYQPAPSLRLFLGYNFESRGSNIQQESSGSIIDPFDYDVRRLVFRLEAGWL